MNHNIYTCCSKYHGMTQNIGALLISPVAPLLAWKRFTCWECPSLFCCGNLPGTWTMRCLGECACGWQSEPQACIPERAVWWWPLPFCAAHSKPLYTLMWVARTRFWERFLLCHWCFSCNRPLALRGHVTNASFKQWVGILLMPKIDRAHKNDLIPEIWEETQLREIFYGTSIFQQSSMICFSYHRGWFLEGWSANLLRPFPELCIRPSYPLDKRNIQSTYEKLF